MAAKRGKPSGGKRHVVPQPRPYKAPLNRDWHRAFTSWKIENPFKAPIPGRRYQKPKKG